MIDSPTEAWMHPMKPIRKVGGGEIYEEKGGILHFESFCLYIKRASEWSLECMC